MVERSLSLALMVLSGWAAGPQGEAGGPSNCAPAIGFAFWKGSLHLDFFF